MAPLVDVLMEGISWFCIVTGSLFAVVGGIGIIRLPDFYSRMHAGGITDTMGAGLILLGLMLQSVKVGLMEIVRSGLSDGLHVEPWLVTVKLVIILFFLLVTSPTSCHALASSALAQGVRPLYVTRRDGD